MIITDEEALRIKCADARAEEVNEIIEALERELEYSGKMGRPGIGLAAPQIGIAKKVAIVRIDKNYHVNLVNCKIKNAYDKSLFKGEGCLSFPDRMEDTMRYQEIHVVDNLVYPYSFVVTGIMAIVCQHELDHLNNILLPDIAIHKIVKKLRPNDPCHCGSGKKFKRCHSA